MVHLPPRETQIIQAHSALIHRVVRACHNPEEVPDLERLLRASAEQGWTALVGAVRQILAGHREPATLAGLDDEDRIIVEAILRGLQDPSSLPDPQRTGDPSMAAPGLASMIHAASTGDAQALQLVASMAEQMSQVGGDMARLASVIRPLVNGERDPERLFRGMSVQGQSLVLAIIEELGRLRSQ